MTTLADSLVAASSRPMPLRMRPDLVARQHRYQGRAYWVIKEPIGLRYFRFQEEEYAVLRMLDGNSSLETIKQRFEREFAPHKMTYSDLQQFIGMLHQSGLVVSDAPGQGQQLQKRRREQQKREWMGRLSNVLALRFKGIDPERLLNFLDPLTRWFFSPTAAICLMLFALSALGLVLVQFDVFRARLPAFQTFFGPNNWLALAITLGLTKVLHEFGHGLLCKRFGGECHEMGVMFLVLTPCLYCNVSDSWMLPSKWQRAAIGAGGIYVELVLASIATYLWWFTEPGTLINSLGLRVMFICSVSTVLFNGNPLLRFDGYYILSDLVEIPNLRAKASKILQRLAAQWCLGLELPEDPFLPQRNLWLFAAYTIAAVVYRWIVFFSILFFLNQVFEPYGLKILGQIIALMGVGGLFVMPVWQLFKFLRIPGRLEQVKRVRVAATVGVVLAVLAGVMLIPVPHNVVCSVQIQPRDSATLFVEVPGRLATHPPAIGAEAQAGQTLAQLENEDLRLELLQLESTARDLELQLNNLIYLQRAGDPEAQLQIKQREKELESITEQLKDKRTDVARLQLVSPITGIVLPPEPRKRAPEDDERMAEWYGTPLDEENQGVFLQVGDPFCRVGNPRELEALLVIDEADIDFVREGQRVKIKLDAHTGATLVGQIKDRGRSEMKIAPPGLSTMQGGELATQMDPDGKMRPVHASYEARVPLTDEDQALRLGMRGRAKIRAGMQTVGARLRRYLERTFHFDL